MGGHEKGLDRAGVRGTSHLFCGRVCKDRTRVETRDRETPVYEAFLPGADPDGEPLMKKHLCSPHLHGSEPVEKTSAWMCKKSTYALNHICLEYS